MNPALRAPVAPQSLPVRAGRSWVAPGDAFAALASSMQVAGALVRTSPLRVLLVDDCPLQQLLACVLLSRWKIVPQIACDGLEAVLLVGEQDFDIVLMDVEMPVMDGCAATVRIRRNERRDRRAQAVPVVVYTADDLASDERRWRLCGMNAVLRKPCEVQEMSACLERWCGAKFSPSDHQDSAGPFRSLQEAVNAGRPFAAGPLEPGAPEPRR